MKANLELSIALLQRGPATFDALLRGIDAEWAECTEGEDSWTPRQIVAHLIHCEQCDWMHRVQMILEHGELKKFEPLDREGGRARLMAMALPALLDEFAALRHANLDRLAALHLKPADLERRGLHPTFGLVTLSQLLATWATHDMTHLHQLSRVLAKQYADEVGPWKRYLGVLHCDGHSERD